MGQSEEKKIRRKVERTSLYRERSGREPEIF